MVKVNQLSENQDIARHERHEELIWQLIGLPELIESEQAIVDDLEIRWAVLKSNVSAAALEGHSWPIKNPTRKATNEQEREIVITRKLNRSKTAKVLRMELKRARRHVAMLRSQQENYRIILARLPE